MYRISRSVNLWTKTRLVKVIFKYSSSFPSNKQDCFVLQNSQFRAERYLQVPPSVTVRNLALYCIVQVRFLGWFSIQVLITCHKHH
jgi:hypothetical protein